MSNDYAITIAPNVTLPVKDDIVDVGLISNLQFLGVESGYREFHLLEPPLLLPSAGGFEVVQNPSIWKNSLQSLSPTHLGSRIITPEKISEVELQDSLLYINKVYS